MSACEIFKAEDPAKALEEADLRTVRSYSLDELHGMLGRTLTQDDPDKCLLMRCRKCGGYALGIVEDRDHSYYHDDVPFCFVYLLPAESPADSERIITGTEHLLKLASSMPVRAERFAERFSGKYILCGGSPDAAAAGGDRG